MNEAPIAGRVPHVRPSVHGPKTEFFQCFHSMRKDSCSWPQSFCHIAKALKGAAPHLFGPCTLGRTWGTRPGRRASFRPPTTATPMNFKERSREELQAQVATGPMKNLLGRFAEPEDVAAVVVFLCLPASRQITAQTLHTSAGAVV